ncbi:MAG: FAD-dependent monooxygenase [Pseudomonadota bacterium]
MPIAAETETHLAHDDYDIAIVGGGLAGATQAIALAATAGPSLRIALVDAPASSVRGNHDPRATAISAASRQLLTAIGVWPDVAQDAQPIVKIELSDTGTDDAVRPTRLSYDNTVIGPDGARAPAAHIVPNAALENAVQARVHNVSSIHRVTARVTALAETSTTVSLAATDRRLTARLLIAADGRRSRIRRLSGIRATTRTHRQSACLAIVAHELPHNGIAKQHFLPGGPFARLPLTGNRTCVTWTERTAEATRLASLSDDAFLAELSKRFGHELGQLQLISDRALFPLETQISRELYRGRTALVGDACRSVHPIAGQGLNLAFRDVAALTECVVDGMRDGLDPGDRQVLARYQRWRRFDSVMSSTAFDGLNSLFSSDLQAVRTVRELGLTAVDRLPALKRFFVTEAAGLTGEVPRLLRGKLVL